MTVLSSACKFAYKSKRLFFALQPMIKGKVSASYTTYTGGMSLGQAAAFTRSVERTWVFSIGEVK